ncbi:MAG: hypothetical protein QNJ91_09825 [Gammaproteobacteria bacterium]|nr:hypothetical protein [Gammaproteobacteria bacterium]
MLAPSFVKRCFLFVLLCGVLSPVVAQQAGESVRIHGAVVDDVYAAGGTVDVLADVDGDVLVAGGRVTVGNRIDGDVMAAGGSVNVHADITDDLRLAGGDVILRGAVRDDAMVAAGNVTLTPDATVGGRAWLSGARIDAAGTIDGGLAAAGGRILLSGQVRGDVDLTGQAISIAESAIIDGNLVYRSPRPAEIVAGAQIRGTTHYEPIEGPVMPIVAAAAGIAILVLLGLMVTGGALFLLFPGFIEAAMQTIRSEPWKTLGLGLALFAATPIVIGLLFATVIGWLPAVVLGAVYLLLMLAGFLTGTFYVGDASFGLSRRDTVSRTKRLVSFVAALVAVLLLALVPLVGALLLFVVLLLGLGTLSLGMYRTYVGP